MKIVIRLRFYRYLTCLERNFAKATEQCGISQPMLSAMLVKLEEELDVRNRNAPPIHARWDDGREDSEVRN